MATNYPGALDTLTNPASTDRLTSPSHASQHANANDAIEAIQATLGTNPQGSESTVSARIAAIEGAGSVTIGALTLSVSSISGTPSAKSSASVAVGANGCAVSVALSAALSGTGGDAYAVTASLRLVDGGGALVQAGPSIAVAGELDATGEATSVCLALAHKFTTIGTNTLQVLVSGTGAGNGGTISTLSGFTIL
jgi:hypothetical protein